MIRSSIIGRVTNNFVRAILAATLATSLGCSGGEANDDTTREDPLELPETLRITVRNTSDQVQYVDNLYFWMRSASVQIVDFDGAQAPGVPALYSNIPTCEQILSGEWHCGGHGDVGPLVRALAPGAEYSEEWNGQAWERSSLEGDPSCQCMVPVKAPEGDYTVKLGASTSVACSDASCPCEPGDSSCVAPGELESPVSLEQAVTWPEQSEVLLVIE